MKLLIDKLKKSIDNGPETKNIPQYCCPETDTEADDYLVNSGPDSPKTKSISKNVSAGEELDDDMPLMSLFQSRKSSSEKADYLESYSSSTKQAQQSLRNFPKTTGNHQKTVGYKRVRVILSDDDDEENDDEMERSNRKSHDFQLEDFATSYTSKF